MRLPCHTCFKEITKLSTGKFLLLLHILYPMNLFPLLNSTNLTVVTHLLLQGNKGPKEKGYLPELSQILFGGLFHSLDTVLKRVYQSIILLYLSKGTFSFFP